MAAHLIKDILQLQECTDTSQNSRYAWADKLKFLHTTNDHSDLQLLEESTDAVDGHYVALSYTWTPSGRETHRAGLYTITTGRNSSPIYSTVRNMIFFRALRFARHHNISRLWIDQHCVDQSNQEEKNKAIQCMDFVYSKSKFPLGLLTAEIMNQGEADLLEALLDGMIIVDDNDDDDDFCPTFREDVSGKECQQLFDLISRLAHDEWWSRRWTFQEEYKSAERMTLLIPLEKHVQKSASLEGIEGEFLAQAIHVREMFTSFLLAWSQYCPHFQREEISILFGRIGSYKVLDLADVGRRLPLPARLSIDVLNRQSGQKWDALAILANICGYETRLDVSKLQQTDIRLGACFLALHFLNGELFRNDCPISPGFIEDDLPARFEALSPEMEYYPAIERRLTFSKQCRLRNPRITKDGIQTEGILWRICQSIHVPKPSRIKAHSHNPEGLNTFQRKYLFKLADELQSIGLGSSQLYSSLHDYLDKDRRAHQIDAAKCYMDTMAVEVVQTIDKGEQLFLAQTGNEVLGIFTNPPQGAHHIFTSWQPPRYRPNRDWNVSQERHISVAVNVETEQHVTRVRYAGWVNGLVFTSGLPWEEVVYCWPPNWT